MIGYSQCWEDAEVVSKALQIESTDIVLSVTSGGCNTLALAASHPSKLYSIDQNIEQNYLLKIKYAAIKSLDHLQVLKFLGYLPERNRVGIYKSLRASLSSDAKDYWDRNSKAIKGGVVNAGKFEGYLWAFRNFVLPMIHSKYMVNELLLTKNHEDQKIFYESKWNTKGWKRIFRFFFSQQVMSRSGRSSEMFTHSRSIPAAQLFYYRTQNAFLNGRLADNFYLSYILRGRNNRLLPDYLKPEVFNFIRDYEHLEVVNSDILAFLKLMPDNSITKYNLSDIFEPLSIESSRNIFEEIYRTAANGSRLIFWNNLVIRDVPDDLKRHFIEDKQAMVELIDIDRVFFYEKFYIYTVPK